MEVPRHWRLKKQRYSMTGEICPNCKTPMFPPRAVCPYCGGDRKAEYEFRMAALGHEIETRQEAAVIG